MYYCEHKPCKYKNGEAWEQGYMLLGKVYLVVTQTASFVLHYMKNAMHSIPFHSILFHSHHSVAWSQCCGCTEQVTYKVSKGTCVESMNC